MSGNWIEVADANGLRRVPLTGRPVRIGSGAVEVTVQGVGSDQLVVTGEPLHVEFVGTGAPPFCDGAPFRERDCAPGEVLEWSGVRVTFGTEAVLVEIADTETEVEDDSPSREENLELAWQRVRAGLYVDLEQADPAVVKRWQRAVVDGEFDIDTCAAEITASATVGDEALLLKRSGRLARDLLMAPLMRGARGAGRKARAGARRGVAFLVAQFTALLVYSAIVVVAMLFLRIRGISFDGLCDSLLGLLRDGTPE